MPAPDPNIAAVRPSSLFIVSAANPTLTRSKKAMTKHRIRNGMRRNAALRDARRAAMSIALPSLNSKRRADSLRLTHAQATAVVKLTYDVGTRLPAVGLCAAIKLTRLRHVPLAAQDGTLHYFAGRWIGSGCPLVARHGHGRRPTERVRCPGNTGSGRDQPRLRGRLWRLRAGPKMNLQRTAAWVNLPK